MNTILAFSFVPHLVRYKWGEDGNDLGKEMYLREVPDNIINLLVGIGLFCQI